MNLNGPYLEGYLNSLPHTTLLLRDKNDYLISYRFDTGAEIAFDPRTTGKASVFIDKLPERLCADTGVGKVLHYPPVNPSTALARVSKALSQQPQIYKIDVKTFEGLERLIEWIRWA